MSNRRTQARNSTLFHDSIADWVRDHRDAEERNHESADSRALIGAGIVAINPESAILNERARELERTRSPERAKPNESTTKGERAR